MRPRITKITGFSFIIRVKEFGMKAHFNVILVEDFRTIQGDVQIEESALSEIVRYLGNGCPRLF